MVAASGGARPYPWHRHCCFIGGTRGCGGSACATSKWLFRRKSIAEREHILKGVYLSLGRLLAEIPKFPDYTLENVDRIAVYDGLENYLAARDRGKGVLFMTAHLGGWEIGSFVHSLHGHWLNIVVRDLDNPLLDGWVRRVRTLHGNKTIRTRTSTRAGCWPR